MTDTGKITLTTLAAELRAQRIFLLSLAASHHDPALLRRQFAELMSHEIEGAADEPPEVYSILRMYEESTLKALGPSG